MSLFSSIAKVVSSVAKPIITVGKNLLGGAVGAFTSALGGGAPAPTVISPTPTLPIPSQMVRTLPPIPATMPGGAPLSTQIGQFLGQGIAQVAGVRGPGVARMKRGRITGNMIPAGFVERMSKTGVVYLGKSGRRRGISGRDLSTWRRVERVVSRIQRAHPMRRRK